jgi:hypothetical protein
MATFTALRRARRLMLEEAQGAVWDTAQLLEEFAILGYRGADCLLVERKADQKKGWMRIDAGPVGSFYYLEAFELPLLNECR